jgi:hypothetical protein
VRQGRQPIPKLQGAAERDTYKLIDIGEPATINGLMKELDIKERMDGLFDRCLKRLLMVRALSSPPSSVSTPQISTSRKAG